MSQKTLNVKLVPNNDPPVEMDPVVLGRKTMRWKPEKKKPNFEFVSFTYVPPNGPNQPPNPFSNTKIKADLITVTNDTGVKGDFEYVIEVREKGTNKKHKSIKGRQPPSGGDKPVIRN